MGGEIEWGEAADSASRADPVDSQGADDLLDYGRDRRPRAVSSLAALAVAAAATAVVAQFTPPATTGGHGTRVATPTSRTLDSGGLLVGEQNVALVRATAADPSPLADFVRPNSARDACTLVTPGHQPELTVATAVRRALPGYVVRDVGRTLDEFTALCVLQLRAANARGATLVIEIVAPAPGARNPYTQLTISNEQNVTAASAVTTTGWTVIVGATGTDEELPPIAALVALAQDPALRW